MSFTDKYHALGLVSDEAENIVLFAMMQNLDFAENFVANNKSEQFHHPLRRLVFESISGLLANAEPISSDTLIAQSKQIIAGTKRKSSPLTADFLATIIGDTGKALESSQRVTKLAWLRNAADFAFWLTTKVQTNPDADNLYIEAQEAWQKISPVRTSNGFTYAWDTIPTHIQQLERRVEERKDGKAVFDWPWASWNQFVRPLKGGMMGLLSAPDGMGKTTFLEMIAEHWAKQQFHTVLVHLEDSPEYKYDRRLARHSTVPYADIEDGNLTAAQMENTKLAYYKIEPWAALFLHYYHAPGKSAGEVVRELEARRAEGICDCVVLDYIDKFSTDTRQRDLYRGDSAVWERQADNSEKLKTFCERNNVPIFTATQGNKSMQNGGTQTRQNIRGSGQKSEKSQLVVILSREIVGDAGLHTQDGKLIASAGEYSPIVNVRVDKQNRGKTGNIKQWLSGSQFKVVDMDSQRVELSK